MQRLFLWLSAALSLWALAPRPLTAQNAIGLDGVISNRDDNAFGIGITYAFDPTAALGSRLEFGLPFGWTGRPKVLASVDLEILTGNFKRDNTCREKSPITGGEHFYHDCDTGVQFAPSAVEGPAPVLAFAAIYAILDLGPFRVGWAHTAGHFGQGDCETMALVGVATSKRSWIMVDLPSSGGFRFRIEAAIWANDLLTF